MTIEVRSVELMLAGASWDHKNGSKAVFWISDEDREWLATKTAAKGRTAGQRFMAAMVEIGDDEQPVPHETKKPSASKFPSGRTGLAVRWGADPDFREWLRQRLGPVIAADIVDEHGVAEYMRKACGVQSRNDLDSPVASMLFDDAFRIPYAASRKARGLDD